MPWPRAFSSTHTAATHGVNCGRSARSEAITEAVPRNASPSWATSANGIGASLMLSRRRPEMVSSETPSASHHARQIRIATVSKNSGHRRRSEMAKARDIDLHSARSRAMLGSIVGGDTNDRTTADKKVRRCAGLSHGLPRARHRRAGAVPARQSDLVLSLARRHRRTGRTRPADWARPDRHGLLRQAAQPRSRYLSFHHPPAISRRLHPCGERAQGGAPTRDPLLWFR